MRPLAAALCLAPLAASLAAHASGGDGHEVAPGHAARAHAAPEPPVHALPPAPEQHQVPGPEAARPLRPVVMALALAEDRARAASRLLLDLTAEGTQVAAVIQAERPSLVQPLAALTREAREQLAAQLAARSGQSARLADAGVERALEVAPPDAALILIGDVDLGQELRERLARGGHPVFVLSTGGHSALLDAAARESGGALWPLDQDFAPTTLSLYAALAGKELLPVVDHTLLVDEAVQRAVIVLPRGGGVKNVLSFAGEVELSEERRRSEAEWRAEREYDLVFLSQPEPGPWRVRLGAPGKAMGLVLESALSLAARLSPEPVPPGGEAECVASLVEPEGRITSFARLDNLRMAVTLLRPGGLREATELSPGPGGEYRARFVHLEPGPYSLSLSARGPELLRVRELAFRVASPAHPDAEHAPPPPTVIREVQIQPSPPVYLPGPWPYAAGAAALVAALALGALGLALANQRRLLSLTAALEHEDEPHEPGEEAHAAAPDTADPPARAASRIHRRPKLKGGKSKSPPTAPPAEPAAVEPTAPAPPPAEAGPPAAPPAPEAAPIQLQAEDLLRLTAPLPPEAGRWGEALSKLNPEASRLLVAQEELQALIDALCMAQVELATQVGGLGGSEGLPPAVKEKTQAIIDGLRPWDQRLSEMFEKAQAVADGLRALAASVEPLTTEGGLAWAKPAPLDLAAVNALLVEKSKPSAPR